MEQLSQLYITNINIYNLDILLNQSYPLTKQT